MSTLGQMRRYTGDVTDGLNIYLTKMSNSIATDTTTVGGIEFTDTVMKVSFTAGNNYYLKLYISPTCINPNTNTVQKIKIYLANSDKSHTQTVVSSLIIDSTATSSNVLVEKIISANYDFTEIYFELTRTSEDYTAASNKQRRVKIISSSESATYGAYVGLLKNQWSSSSPITKIGVQGPANLLMCINGEEIRIGYSGIYEIYVDYEITFLGFAVTETLTPENYFMVDYQY